jgi:hypothetical protein
MYFANKYIHIVSTYFDSTNEVWAFQNSVSGTICIITNVSLLFISYKYTLMLSLVLGSSSDKNRAVNWMYYLKHSVIHSFYNYIFNFFIPLGSKWIGEYYMLHNLEWYKVPGSRNRKLNNKIKWNIHGCSKIIISYANHLI